MEHPTHLKSYMNTMMIKKMIWSFSIMKKQTDNLIPAEHFDVICWRIATLFVNCNWIGLSFRWTTMEFDMLWIKITRKFLSSDSLQTQHHQSQMKLLILYWFVIHKQPCLSKKNSEFEGDYQCEIFEIERDKTFAYWYINVFWKHWLKNWSWERIRRI